MTATVLPGSNGQACWRFTITDGQHKNRQFLTATGRPRLAAATLLPGTVSKQLRAAGDTTKLQTTFDRAKLLMSLEDEQTVATVSTPAEKPRVSENRVMELLVEQVAALSKQVEALSTRPGNQQPDSRPVRCFNCGKPGHIRRHCRYLRPQPDARNQQRNFKGMSAAGNCHPVNY